MAAFPRINPFLFKLHWGDPKYPTEIRAWTGALGKRIHGVEQPWQHCFTTHHIGRWYGISYARTGFVGLCVFGPSDDYRTTDAPRFGHGAELSADSLRAAHQAAERLIYSLLGNEDDESEQAKKLLAWSNAASVLNPAIHRENYDDRN